MPKPRIEVIRSFARQLLADGMVRFSTAVGTAAVTVRAPDLETSPAVKKNTPPPSAPVTHLYIAAAGLLVDLCDSRGIVWNSVYGLLGNDEDLAELFFCSAKKTASQVIGKLLPSPACCSAPMCDVRLPELGRLLVTWSADEGFFQDLQSLIAADLLPNVIIAAFADRESEARAAAMHIALHPIFKPSDLVMFACGLGLIDHAAHDALIAAIRRTVP